MTIPIYNPSAPQIINPNAASYDWTLMVVNDLIPKINSEISNAISSAQAVAFSTRAAVAAATIAGAATFLILCGYTAAGDMEKSVLFKKVVSEPTHPGKIQSGDGAWWEMVENRPSILMFGASESASASDNTTAIHNALEYTVEEGHNYLYIPAGTYSCNAITLPGSVTIEGSGFHTSILSFGSGIVGIKRASTLNTDVVNIRYLGIVATGSTGIQLGDATTNVTESRIENVRISGASIGFDIYNCGGLEVKDNFFFECTNSGIRLQAPLNPDGGDNLIADNYFLNSGVGVINTGVAINHIAGGGLKVRGNKILHYSKGYLLNASFAGGVCSAIMISNNSIEGCAASCIELNNQLTTSGEVFNVNICDNAVGANSGTTYAIVFFAPGNRTWIHNAAICGNVTRNLSGATGIAIAGTEQFSIVGNTIGEAGTPIGPGINVTSTSRDGLIGVNMVTDYATPVVNSGTNVTATGNNGG